MSYSEEFLEKIRKEDGYDAYLRWKRRGNLTREQITEEDCEKVRKEQGYDAYLEEKKWHQDLHARIMLASYSSHRSCDDDSPSPSSSYSYSSSDSGVDAVSLLNIITSTF